MTPNGKCSLFLLSVRPRTESNFLEYIQLPFSISLILVWDFLFSLNNTRGCLGSSLIKVALEVQAGGRDDGVSEINTLEAME